MNLSDIKYKTMYTSSLNVGSTFSEDDLMFYTEGYRSANFPFGDSEKDLVKISIFNFDETFVTASVIYSSGSHKSYTQSFYDVTNKYITYSYKEFNNSFPILSSSPSSSIPSGSNSVTIAPSTSSLFLDISKELNKIGIPDGNYKISIELLRELVGTETGSEEKLIIDTISPSRTEIAVVPKTLRGIQSKTIDEFYLFSNSQFQVKEIAENLKDSISNPQIYNIYYAAKQQYTAELNSFKYSYGFTRGNTESASDIDVINFLTDLYYGVKKGKVRNSGEIATNDILGIYDQFKNWLYQNYEAGATFQDIRDYYYSIFRYVLDQELNRITNQKPSNYNSILSFFQAVYYDSIFYPTLYSIEIKYNVDILGYFKNYINFSSGEKFAIMNKKVIVSTNLRFHNKLVLKLDKPLPNSFLEGDYLWITNDFGFLPIIQNLYYFSKNIINTIPLRGPNFNIKIESKGNSTEALSMEQLIDKDGTEYDDLVSKLSSISSTVVDTTNYRYFENFINFSSANLRVNAFNRKKTEIENIKYEINELDVKITLNPDDQFYIKEKKDLNSRINELENSMDGYEKFLYNNPAWYIQHEESSSMYDKNNGNSLINNLPQFIIEDYTQNQDYIIFVGMVGHFFDNISLLVKQFTEKNNYTNSPNYGISVDIVEDMLASLGWEVEISKENLPLLLSTFSNKEFDIGSDLYNLSNKLSEENRNQIIWKRILNTLPYIYKTKGTEASLSSLLSCFGIPKNVIKLKEYGGIRNVHNLQDTSLYVIDEVKYEPYFSGSGEYFALNWTGSSQTIEFNFSFDPSKINNQGSIFRLVNCPDNWVVGVYREKGVDWGKLFFSIDDGSGNIKTIITDKAPIFDGNTYHAMVRRNNPSVGFSMYGFTESQIDSYPIKYDLVLQRAEDERITFEATSSQYLSGSFNTNFRAGTYFYVGNYNQNTASLNIDPDAFFGNIDEIKLWEAPLDDNRFKNHTLHQNSYDSDSPVNMIADNLIRVSFERPVDLYDYSPVTLNNLAFRSDFPTFQAINFPEKLSIAVQVSECDPALTPAFPYQFTRKNTRQTIKLPDYGSSKFRSNKINYVEQELVASLSPTERSSVKSSELVSVGSNKIGLFFSPSEIQNTEIIKFFGDYPLSELIGDPSTVYESSYARFENFRQIFYDQGFGNIDYQFFMNVVRFYFDKAMFKYIRSIVPARAKLVDGILIEPSILERPKIQLKPLVKENVGQRDSHVWVSKAVEANQFPVLSDTIKIKNEGTSILTDVNQVFFPTDEDHFGFGVFAEDGLTYYNEAYYRADVIKIKKQYQNYRKYNLPTNTASLNNYEINVNLNGTLQTISSSYYKINMTKLPTLYEYTQACSFLSSNFSGSVDFNPGFTGTTSGYVVSSSHHIDGIFYGNLIGDSGQGTIYLPGINVQADYVSLYPVTYIGTFTYTGGTYYFDGTIDGGVPATINLTTFDTTFYVSSTGGITIFDYFKYYTAGPFFKGLSSGINYRKEYSMQNYPYNATLLDGYFSNHYKFSKQQFSVKEINSYDNINKSFKWKKNSQNKKTTVDPTTGLLDNSDPVETKTV